MEIFRSDMKMNIVSVYLKSVSFKVFDDQAETLQDHKAAKPNIDVELKTAARKISKENYEIVLHANITAEQNRKPAFQIKVKQAGIFEFNYSDKDAAHLAIYACLLYTSDAADE